MAKLKNAIGTVHAYKYGTAETVAIEGAYRIEIYRPREVSPREPWNAAVRERCMVTGPTDATPRHDKSQAGGYSADCSACWLNITHSEAVHARATGKAV